MLRALPALLAALFVACSGGAGAAPQPSLSASVSAGPTSSPAVAVRAPAVVIVAAGDVGLRQVGGADHVSAGEAAHVENNEPLALTTYARWGWVDEATRDFAAGGARVHVDLLLLSRDEGAKLAFAAWSSGAAGCPAAVGADDCGLVGSTVVARVGPYVLRVTATGADPAAIATRQVSKLRE